MTQKIQIGSMTETNKLVAEIFDIYSYIRIIRQFKNDFHYSNHILVI
jgi:hypothetical protein